MSRLPFRSHLCLRWRPPEQSERSTDRAEGEAMHPTFSLSCAKKGGSIRELSKVSVTHFDTIFNRTQNRHLNSRHLNSQKDKTML